jgi:hypothetical protein
MLLTMWRSGMRKDEAIRLCKDAAERRPEGGYNICSGASKTDPFGEVWGADVVRLPPAGGPLGASAAVHVLQALPGRPFSLGREARSSSTLTLVMSSVQGLARPFRPRWPSACPCCRR